MILTVILILYYLFAQSSNVSAPLLALFIGIDVALILWLKNKK